MGGPTTRDMPVRHGRVGLGRAIYEVRARFGDDWGLEGHGEGGDARVISEAVAVAVSRGWTAGAAYRRLLDGLRDGCDLDNLLLHLWYGPTPSPQPPVPLRPTRRQRPRPRPRDERTCRLPAMAAARHALG